VLAFTHEPALDIRRGTLLLGDRGAATARAFADHLVVNRHRWDVLHLDGFRADSEALALFEQAAQAAGLIVGPRTPAQTSWVLPIATDWKRYLASQSRHFRRSCAFEQRRLEALGAVATTMYRAADIERGLEQATRILCARFGVATIDDLPAGDRQAVIFANDVARRYSADAEIHVLTVDDHPAACILGLVRDGILYALLTKYDPALSAASPGRAVFLALLEAAFHDGRREVDFVSSWPYIGRLTRDQRQYVSATFYHRGLYSRSLRLGRDMLDPVRRRIAGVFTEASS
jgi:CelD/BcsL family acetyltransferase involved in cellulose biosynthesis